MRGTFVLVFAASLAVPALAQSSGSIRVQVTGAESADGRIGCALWNQGEGFPRETENARSQQWTTLRGTSATCVFRDVPSGRYAISIMHDADGDGELDTNLFGVPREGWGVSKNLGIRRLRAPRFSEAAFEFDGAVKEVRIRLRY
ncbi:MAG: DUF2141 domain-containing protein [Myxococcota bacterium]